MNIKLQMKILLCSLLLLFPLVYLVGCGDDNSETNPTFKVQFIIDDEIFYEQVYDGMSKVDEAEPDAREGFIFKGWYMNGDYTVKWNFDSDIVTSDTKFYGYYVAIPEETFNVLYYDDGLLIKSDKVLKYDTAEQFNPQHRSGYEFKGWFNGETKFNFNMPITDDVILTSKFEAIVYHVKFVADKKIISDIEYTVENLSIEEPQVPVKAHYDGEWSEYELNLTDIEVVANYTPTVYKANYFIDDEIYEIVEFTIEDELIPPIIPVRKGFEGAWFGFADLGKDSDIVAKYTPIEYHITYSVDGKVLKVLPYTVLTSQVNPPAVPDKDGYVGSWEKVDYELEDVTIRAQYQPITYYATFVSEGKHVATEPFTVENKNITIPEIPLKEKPGYTVKWQDFELGSENITIDSMYVLLTFNAKFYADGVLLSSVDFTVEDELMAPPAIPDKAGYTSYWQKYEIVPHDFEVNAGYTPIIYYVTFVSYGSEVSLQYTVENREISEPEPALRKHYNVKWQEYEITIGNLTVNAIYTPVTANAADFEYTENSDGSLTITKYIGTDTDVFIPADIGDKSVKVIGNMAFNNGNIKELELCYGIETIEKEAFLQCENLKSVILPKSLKVIEKYAFAFSGITEIDIPDSVTEIGEQAFAYTPLVKAEVSDSLIELTNIFFQCTKLEELNLGHGLQIIKSNALDGCTALKFLRLPKSLRIIEPNIFIQTNIVEVEFEDINNWNISASGSFSDPVAIFPEKLADNRDACQMLVAHSPKYWYHTSEI